MAIWKSWMPHGETAISRCRGRVGRTLARAFAMSTFDFQMVFYNASGLDGSGNPRFHTWQQITSRTSAQFIPPAGVRSRSRSTSDARHQHRGGLRRRRHPDDHGHSRRGGAIVVGVVWIVRLVGDSLGRRCTHTYTVHPRPAVPHSVARATTCSPSPAPMPHRTGLGRDHHRHLRRSGRRQAGCASSFLGVLGTLPSDDDDAQLRIQPGADNPDLGTDLTTTRRLPAHRVQHRHAGRLPPEHPDQPALELTSSPRHRRHLGDGVPVASSSGSNAVGGQWNWRPSTASGRWGWRSRAIPAGGVTPSGAGPRTS